MAVPAYFFPAGDNLRFWDQLRKGYPAVTTTVATGLGLGGSVPDTNYQYQIRQTRAAGIRVLAYVTTSGGAKPLATAQREIAHAYAWYGVDGIFFDESVAYPVTCDQVGYYSALNQFAKSIKPGATTALNHGQILPECYASVSDVMVTAETDYGSYKNTWRPWGWEQRYPSGKFWHIVHGADTIDKMKQVVELSRARNAGHVFVTSATAASPGGPYGSLPSSLYWNAERSAVSAPPTSSPATASLGA